VLRGLQQPLWLARHRQLALPSRDGRQGSFQRRAHRNLGQGPQLWRAPRRSAERREDIAGSRTARRKHSCRTRPLSLLIPNGRRFQRRSSARTRRSTKTGTNCVITALFMAENCSRTRVRTASRAIESPTRSDTRLVTSSISLDCPRSGIWPPSVRSGRALNPTRWRDVELCSISCAWWSSRE
jgi:hypothetical protein